MFDYQAAIAFARREHNWDSFPVVILDPWAEFLADKPGNVTSQNGEDGLLAALFERIGTRNKWCFEVGAHDGEYLSNTWALRQVGWRAVLIEADDGHYQQLSRRNYGPDWAWLCHKRIGSEDLDRLLKAIEVPADLDLGVIDIDGDDVKVWEGMTDHRPRVVLIEYNTSGQDGFLGGFDPPTWQAGPETVLALGRRKGYRPLVKTACNLLFVDEAEINRLTNPPPTL